MSNLKIDTTEQSIDSFFDHKLDKVYPSEKALREALKSGKQLKFYMGADVTAPRLHIGHIIPFLKMSRLQKMGHQIIFLIGDFTGKIGDPTDKSAARRKLTDEEVQANSASFVAQIKNIFDFDSEDNAPLIKYNSTWNSALDFSDVIELASNFTVQQMIERDMFQKRLKEGKPIYLHEFLYPLIQGYDSVAMEVDGEFGGSDQTFNMLAGRTLMKGLKNKEKFVITTNLLLSNDGVNKMSKSIGNCIFLTDSAHDKFGKIMSIPDNLIVHYYELLSDYSEDKLSEIRNKVNNGDNPMELKKQLGLLVVSQLDGEEKAIDAKEHFEKTVQNKEIPEDLPTIKREHLIAELARLGDINETTAKEVLTASGMTVSNGEAKRLISEGAVEFNGEKIIDPNSIIDIPSLYLIKSGKRKWLRIS